MSSFMMATYAFLEGSPVLEEVTWEHETANEQCYHSSTGSETTAPQGSGNLHLNRQDRSS